MPSQPSRADQPPTSVAQASAVAPGPQDSKPAVPTTAATIPTVTAPTGSAPPFVAALAPTTPASTEAEALTDPLPAVPSLDPGEAARAHVSVGGRRTPLLSPNQLGAFPRVYLPQGGQADVQLQLPDAAPGDQVVAAVEDGGRFANGQPVQAFTLDDNRRLAFQFQANQGPGTFRVSVRHGAQTKIVSFWAGDHTSGLNR